MEKKTTNREKVMNIAATMAGKMMHWCEFVKLVKMTTGARIVREDWVRQTGSVSLCTDWVYLKENFKPVKKRFPYTGEEYTCEQIKDATLWYFANCVPLSVVA